MQDSPSLYTRASEAAARGDKLTAKNLLDELLFNEPNNEQAWLLLSGVVEDLNEVSDCLQHALAINPQDQAAQQKYNDLLQRVPELAELDPAKIAAAKKAEEAKKKAAADPNAGLDLDNLDLTPLYGDKDRLDPAKVAAPKIAEEAKKKAPPDPDAGLDLDHLDLTPLNGDKDG